MVDNMSWAVCGVRAVRKSQVGNVQRNGRARGVLCRRGAIISEPQCGDGLVDTEVGLRMVVTNWGKVLLSGHSCYTSGGVDLVDAGGLRRPTIPGGSADCQWFNACGRVCTDEKCYI